MASVQWNSFVQHRSIIKGQVSDHSTVWVILNGSWPSGTGARISGGSFSCTDWCNPTTSSTNAIHLLLYGGHHKPVGPVEKRLESAWAMALIAQTLLDTYEASGPARKKTNCGRDAARNVARE